MAWLQLNLGLKAANSEGLGVPWWRSLVRPREDASSVFTGRSEIGIAVPDLDSAAKRHREIVGAEVSEAVKMFDEGVEVVSVKLPTGVCLELIHPLGEDEDNPVAKFLQRNPEGGIHYICLAVDDITPVTNYFSSEIGQETLDFRRLTRGADGKMTLSLNPIHNDPALYKRQMPLEFGDVVYVSLSASLVASVLFYIGYYLGSR